MLLPGHASCAVLDNGCNRGASATAITAQKDNSRAVRIKGKLQQRSRALCEGLLWVGFTPSPRLSRPTSRERAEPAMKRPSLGPKVRRSIVPDGWRFHTHIGQKRRQ